MVDYLNGKRFTLVACIILLNIKKSEIKIIACIEQNTRVSVRDKRINKICVLLGYSYVYFYCFIAASKHFIMIRTSLLALLLITLVCSWCRKDFDSLGRHVGNVVASFIMKTPTVLVLRQLV